MTQNEKMVPFYSCVCDIFFRQQCVCLPEKEKNDSTKIYKFHHHKYCFSDKHKKFQTSGYYLVQEKPYWKHSCFAQLFEEKTIKRLTLVCIRFDLFCKCTTKKNCNLCHGMVKYPSASDEPKINFNNGNELSVKIIMKIHNCLDCESFS